MHKMCEQNGWVDLCHLEQKIFLETSHLVTIKLNAFPTLTCENNCLRWKLKMHYMSLTNTSHGLSVVTLNWWENRVKIWSQNWRHKMWLMKWYNVSSTKFKFGQTLWNWLWCYCEQPMGHIGNLGTHGGYWCPFKGLP